MTDQKRDEGFGGSVGQEWADILQPLLPIGGRLAPLLLHPGDRQLRCEFHDALYSTIAHGYVGLLYADPAHPDWTPYYNPGYGNNGGACPDFIYYVCPVNDDGTYRISGFRGTVRCADFGLGSGPLFPTGKGNLGPTLASHDLDSLQIGEDGSFEVIVSPERPAANGSDWWELKPGTSYIMVRLMYYDWANETAPRLTIDRLDTPVSRPRPTFYQLEERLKQIAEWVESMNRFAMEWANSLAPQGLVNVLGSADYGDYGGVKTQAYTQGMFDLEPGEALILEAKLPEPCRYWSFALEDELARYLDYQTRQTSLNGHDAVIDPDGCFRAVIAATDPGIPNWLDTAGYQRGILFGRRYMGADAPVPTLKKVKLADVRAHLPSATPVVSPEQRDASLRERKRAAQLRRKW
ncbi:DUF1214 domain-containing protein [Parasphingorhabdus sp.]|uniref:DUF1214 domain-containing protein n=1 Tax=Parasphingorhabdus sp. TaxID=2709688 RepID=UPI003A9303E9